MKIYLDLEYKCHVAPAEDRRELDLEYFDGKCDAFVEGYCYVPFGETWTRTDGMEFEGELVFPWGDYAEMCKAQLEYELAQIRAELEDADAALTELGVTVDG